MSDDHDELVRAAIERARAGAVAAQRERSRRQSTPPRDAGPLCARGCGHPVRRHDSFYWLDKRKAHLTCPRSNTP